ncbi:MAG: DNA recombination protein RmuC [Bacteroidales bacterium]|nr:DNA recombination protein RmuC [Bacteroidales bacterium]
MEYIYLLAGLALGAFIVWLSVRSIVQKQKIDFQERLNKSETESSVLKEKIQFFSSENDKYKDELGTERQTAGDLSNELAGKEVEIKNFQEKIRDHKTELENINKRLKDEFENLANKILDDKSRKFTEQNRNNLTLILDPLKEKISSFEKKVTETYEKSLADRTSLRTELKNLQELNIKISEDATNLTNALKSDVKKQGNWGEIVLERVLERSGLTKGVEYVREMSVRSEDGDLLRPDVVIHLPEKKHLIIDSKVSLKDYEAFINAETQEEKDLYLKKHVASIKTHIKLLSEKNYQLTEEFDTPDFVLLFMPIESAFGAAVSTDIDLFNFAWERKIVIVSPSTLLATLKTVESIWRQEKQTQNALEIARQGGNLYDKFISFVNDIEKLGNQINTVSKTYGEVHKKITSGKGDLISRAEKLRELGAKTSKILPDKYKPEGNEVNAVEE